MAIIDYAKTGTTFQPSRYDVCVIGAGAAGITLAIELSAAGKKVALCEAGGLSYDQATQDPYKGTVKGDPYFELDAARLRFLGGTTNHWAGWCRSFEPIDFNRKYMGEEFQWPIEHAEFMKYREPASKILEIPNQFNDGYIGSNKSVHIATFQFSPPVRFGLKYKEFLEQSEHIDLFLNANLTDIAGTNHTIKKASFSTYEKHVFSIEAKRFVFAMGGIENSRFLLAFAQRYGSQFFDASAPIGKYWMEHPHFTIGHALVNKDVTEARFFSIDPEIQKQEGILNCGFRLDHYEHSFTKELVTNLLCTAPTIGKKIAKLAHKNLICGTELRAAWEQKPTINNNIALSANKDAFGIPRVVLNWKKSSYDRRTLERSVAIFNDWLLKSDLGRFKFSEWLLNKQDYPLDDERAGYHHMGGTRMAFSSRHGVVDANCKVFGSDNLYIAGSSIFTTGGHNNPTLPIVQFAIRLAEHLVQNS